MGYFIRNILVYGAIAAVLWMLYSGIRGLSKKKKNDWFELNPNCIFLICNYLTLIPSTSNIPIIEPEISSSSILNSKFKLYAAIVASI